MDSQPENQAPCPNIDQGNDPEAGQVTDRSENPDRRFTKVGIRRYLEFLSAIEDPRNGRDQLDKLSQSVQNEGRSYPGFSLFDADDEALFSAVARGEFNISGMQNKTLRRFLPDKNSGQMSRLLKRLRVHGLVKRSATPTSTTWRDSARP